MKQSNGKSDKSTSTRCENIQQYLLSSSLHGLRYIGSASLSVFERVFFGLSFMMVICLAAYFISNVWQKWKETPVIIGLDPVSTNIKDIPFPAVTICNMNQVKKSFAKSLKSVKDKVILDSICSQGDSVDNETNVEGKWSYVREFLLKASQPCEEMIQLCKFGMKNIECDNSFSSVLTDEGLCCTFNAINPKLLFKDFDPDDHVTNGFEDDQYMTWSPETGYEKSDREPYPTPVPGPGSNMGLTLILDADVANYYCSSTSSSGEFDDSPARFPKTKNTLFLYDIYQKTVLVSLFLLEYILHLISFFFLSPTSGFKVLLHSPIETPKMANFGFFISPGLETKVVISPKISEASQLIRKVPVQQRQCIFANEANLSYYNIYSKKNCEMECSSKKTEQECECTLFYMPRNNGKICNRKKATCYEKVLYNIALSMEQNYTCNDCLPACFEINYGREISSSKLGIGEFLTNAMDAIANRNATDIRDNLAIIHIFFIDNAYGGFTKSELIGFTEFLSNTGGLLGLFMGFSVISLIEIIYFLSLRPYCAQKRAGKMQHSDMKILFSSQHNNNGLRGSNNKATIIGQPYPTVINEYYMRNEKFEQKNLCQQLQSKLISALHYIKEKLLNVWQALTEMYHERNDEGQAPYPFYN